ncbi:MAG: phosphohydrolase [Brevundimonas sp.]|uniref:HD domain-containing protein n=1 Tax=Brevundimonas sp. TaxID=1871086 RepID=UPI00391A31A0
MTAMIGIAPEDVLADLRNRYAEPHRHYHTWAHIEAMLGWLALRRDHLHDPAAVELAILFHDAVYDPARPDNEAQSAQLLQDADLPDVADDTRLRAVRMIEATAAHGLADNLSETDRSDMAEFLDMDLSILGAAPAVFEGYERAIRDEYAFVPEDLFRAARRGILERFLERPTLYFSDWGRDRFEAGARSNVAASIAVLS